MKQLVESCETCRQCDRAQPKETLKSTPVPKRPWERIATDLFSYKGKDFLITVDYYSNFWEIDQLASTSAPTVITKLKNHFARYGCPDTVVSGDNGPQFTSQEFAHFFKTWQFKHRTISPGNSKANGKVEAAVKTAKQLLRKSSEIHLALLDHRNTPSQGTSTSPAQRPMSRRTKTLLPTTEALLKPQVPDVDEQRQLLRQQQLKQAQYYNKTARDLLKLEIGDVVRMKPIKKHERKWHKATVTSKKDDRSYEVETPEGGIYRRNRFHLRKTRESPPPKPVEPATPEDQPADLPQPSELPASAPPQTVPASAEPNSRPIRNRRPPSYLKDYVVIVVFSKEREILVVMIVLRQS